MFISIHMKIKALEFKIENLKLTKPYRIAFKTVDFVENLFCIIRFDNDILGFGSCNPENEVAFISRSKSINRLEALDQDMLKNISIENDPMPLIQQLYSMIGDVPTIHAMLEMAIWDAFAKHLDKPLLTIWGKKIDPLSTSVTIGIMDTIETLDETAKFLKAGFDHIKIKIGLNPEEDAERIKKLLEKYGHQIILRADINQGYTLEEYKRFILLTKELPIELHEQPLRRDQFSQIDILDANEKSIIAADESLLNIDDALAITHYHRCGILNIKIMKCGGWLQARQIGALGLENYIDLMWGCNDESRISIAAAMTMAYASANTRYLDLDGSFDLAYDPALRGFDVKNGKLIPLDSPGLGIDLDFI